MLKLIIDTISGQHQLLVCCNKMYSDIQHGIIYMPDVSSKLFSFRKREYPFTFYKNCPHCGTVAKITRTEVQTPRAFMLNMDPKTGNHVIRFCCSNFYNMIQSYYEGKETFSVSLPSLEQNRPWLIESEKGYYENENYYRDFYYRTCPHCDRPISVHNEEKQKKNTTHLEESHYYY